MHLAGKRRIAVVARAAGFDGGSSAPDRGRRHLRRGGDSIHAFKRANGEPIWRHGVLDDRPTVSPSFMLQFGPGSMQSHGSASDGSLLYQSIHDQCRVIALDCHTGKQSWSYAARAG